MEVAIARLATPAIAPRVTQVTGPAVLDIVHRGAIPDTVARPIHPIVLRQQLCRHQAIAPTQGIRAPSLRAQAIAPTLGIRARSQLHLVIVLVEPPLSGRQQHRVLDPVPTKLAVINALRHRILLLLSQHARTHCLGRAGGALRVRAGAKVWVGAEIGEARLVASRVRREFS